MPARDYFKFPYPKGTRRLEDLSTALERNLKRPITGVTQGGSSRDNPGAKVAATIGLFHPKRVRRKL